jgi:DNA replication protein DnaC
MRQLRGSENKALQPAPKKEELQLLSKLYEHTNVMIVSDFAFAECTKVFGDAKMTTALLDRLTHHSHIVKSVN